MVGEESALLALLQGWKGFFSGSGKIWKTEQMYELLIVLLYALSNVFLPNTKSKLTVS